MLTLRDLYARACKWRGARDFFADEQVRIPGEVAWRESVALAANLERRGLVRGTMVAFLCGPSARHAVAWFGLAASGAVVCSMHVRETSARLAEALGWLEARFLIHDTANAALAADIAAQAGVPVETIDLDREWSALTTDKAASTPRAPQPDDLAAIILSSGSTGRPKGVMHTHRTLVANAFAGQMLYGTVGVHDATLIMMQPSFAAWVNVVVPYVGGRGKVVFGARFTPEIFLATLERERITMAPAVPTMWRMMLAGDTSGFDLSSVRIVSISGEPPSASDLERIHARLGCSISSFHASSEAGCGGALLATERDTLRGGKPESTGKPVAGADVRIVDPAGAIDAVLPPGMIGEIAIAGTSTAIGYWKDPALTREKFVDGWWRSGDVGLIDTDGDVHVLGRTDNVIRSGGMKIHGETVERALLAHPAVAQAAVIGVPDATWGERIEAHVVLRPGTSVASEALIEHCRATLAGFEVPKAVHLARELPTGPTGKLYRRGLKS